MRALLILFLVVGIASLMSCESVKPYQRVYLNDYEMKMGAPGSRGFEQYVCTIREGASGGGSTKTSGGCGCN